MKIIKPQKLSLQFKTYEAAGRFFFFPAVFVLFPFDNPTAIHSEVALWKLVAEKLGKDAILDMGMPKPRGEALVTGACCTPGGKPHQACAVTMKIGGIKKTLFVFGNRYWTPLGGISQPEHFTIMPLTWQNAFGGSGYGLNPSGKGFVPVIDENGREIHLLPNIEDPEALVGSPGDRPMPAGFAPLDLTWQQRFCKVGTYDGNWLETRFPGCAEDMDPTFFNTAPEDQWLTGYFKGDEAFSLEHMHPQHKRVSGQLPGLTARCFIRRATGEPEALEEIAMRLETVHLFPEARQGILIFRGGAEIATDDGDDISLVMAAAEKTGEPKTPEHYRDVVAKRLDKEMGAIHSLRDSDLLPLLPEMAGKLQEMEEMERLLSREDLLRKNMRAGAEKKLAEAREQIARLGVNPDDHLPAVLPPDPPPPDFEKMDVKLLEIEELKKKAVADAELQQAEAERQIKELCSRQGVDYDHMVAEAKKQQGGRPKLSADQQIRQMKDLQAQLKFHGKSSQELDKLLADPEFERNLHAAEDRIREAYRKHAQHFPPAPALSHVEAVMLRTTVVSGYAAGDGFTGSDLTGADLSGLSLANADFRDAILEGVNFTGSDLSGADFGNAVLAGANLTGAKCAGAKFGGANIGRAVLKDADFSGGLDMRGAVLAKSDLSGAKFNGADLTGADLSGCIFHNTDLAGATAPQLLFISSDLRGLRCAGADLSDGIFIETDVSGVDFSGTKLVSAVFLTAKGNGASFQGADLENLRIVKDSDFAGADFSRARLERANLRGTNLEGASFEKASLNNADLSQCGLQHGNLYQATARGTRFEKTDLTNADLAFIDLMQGCLRKARFHGADFYGANLYEVDFEKSKGDRHTNFRDANLKKTRMTAWKPATTHD